MAITGLVKSFETKQSEDAQTGLKALKISTVLSGLAGGLIGFKIGGLKGAAIGATLSMSLTSLISSLTMKNNTNDDEQSVAKKIRTVLAGIAGAAIGMKFGGLGGALIGASIGISISLLAGNLNFSDKTREDAQSMTRKVKEMLETAASGAFLGGAIGFVLGGPGGVLLGMNIGMALSLIIKEFDIVDKVKASTKIDEYVSDILPNAKISSEHTTTSGAIAAELVALKEQEHYLRVHTNRAH